MNPNSIAVLPFVNMSDDKDNQYFSDGISEEILNVLARISGLQVAARTSSFSFRDTKKEAPEISQELTCACCSKAACASRASACASRRS